MSELKVIQKKHDPDVILNREQFGHLEYAVVTIEKAELPQPFFQRKLLPLRGSKHGIGSNGLPPGDQRRSH